mmetsp:Transcript_98495/g.212401  ORF Transcript_98495/g.212401 Transcript_98495/m.212401 type:complete len:93 (+) Transcript_98495:1203-1481(+)
MLMNKEGKVMVGYSKEGEFHDFWRMCCTNPYNSFEDIEYVLEMIIYYTSQFYTDNTNQYCRCLEEFREYIKTGEHKLFGHYLQNKNLNHHGC